MTRRRADQYCPSCGQRIWRLDQDRFLKCHRCGWTVGVPVLRWILHWSWIRYYANRISQFPVATATTFALKLTVLFVLAWGVLHFGGGIIGGFEEGIGNQYESTTSGYADPDDDRIRTHAENETNVNGAALPNADPHQKDLYIVVLYSADSQRLTATEKRQLKEIWANMDVSNPGDGRGIRLHIVEERRGQKRYRFTEESVNAGEHIDLYREQIDEGCGVYHLVILGEVDSPHDVGGWGDSPGYAVVVSDDRESFPSAEYGERVRSITHELLHNIVGEIDGPHAPGEPSHSREGWLSHVERAGELRQNERLSDAVATQLSEDGFRDSEFYRQEVC